MFHTNQYLFLALDPGRQMLVIITALLGPDGDGEDPGEGLDEDDPDRALWTLAVAHGRKNALELLEMAQGDEDVIPDLIPEAMLAEVGRWEDAPDAEPSHQAAFAVELGDIYWAMSQADQLEPLRDLGVVWAEGLAGSDGDSCGLIVGFRDEAGVHNLEIVFTPEQMLDLLHRIERWDPRGASFLWEEHEHDLDPWPAETPVPMPLAFRGIIPERINTQWANVHGGENRIVSEEFIATLPPEVATAAREMNEQAAATQDKFHFKDHKGILN